MEIVDGTLQIDSFLALTLGIIVLFVGKRLNDAVPFLREFSIPEPVTGGLLFSILFGILYAVLGLAVEFELEAHDGTTVRSADLTGRPFLLFFYPKADTPR